MIEYLTLKEAEKLGTNKRIIEFNEFSYTMRRYTNKFSFEGLRVLFDYFNERCGNSSTDYGHWSQYYSECSFEEFVEIVEDDGYFHSCNSTKESILEYLEESDIEDTLSVVGLTEISVVYYDRKKYRNR